jgi:hypothetical protein
LGKVCRNGCFCPNARQTSSIESVSILLRRKLKIWPERVSIFQQNWPFRGIIKASFINIYGRAAASGLRNEPHTSAGRPFCVSANCCFVVCLFENAFVTLTEKFNLRAVRLIHLPSARKCESILLWRSTFGLWFMNFPPHRPGSDFGHANRRPQRRLYALCMLTL